MLTAPISALPNNALIVLIGDSLTHGYGDANPPPLPMFYDGFRPTLNGDLVTGGYTALQWIGGSTSGSPPTDHHRGVDGWTCADHIADAPTQYGAGQPFPHVDIFGVQIGTNDSTVTFAANYRSLLRLLHSLVPGARFVCSQLPARTGSAAVPVNNAAMPGYWNELGGEGIVIYRAQPGANIFAVPDLTNYYNPESPNFTHLNPTGYSLVGHSDSPVYLRALQGAQPP